MAEQKGAQRQDIVSRLADAGEDALRWFLGLPRRVVAGAIDAAGEQLDEAAARLRGIDQLQRRVDALEQRLDSVEKPTAGAARTTPTARTKPSTASTQSTAVGPPSQHGDAGAADEPAR